MAIDIKAPQFPESVEEGSVASWHKRVGEFVSRDELIVDIETDKTVLEVVAADDGVLVEITKKEGDIVLSQELIGRIEPGVQAPVTESEAVSALSADAMSPASEVSVNPAAKKLAEENQLDITKVQGSGKDGRILKEDVQAVLNSLTMPAPATPTQPAISLRQGREGRA